LVRRRIKFVVEKGAMARLFRAGTSSALQDELFRRLLPADLVRLKTRDQYDDWLAKLIGLDCWEDFSRNGLKDDRWAYFAKLINIVVYEIVANRELFPEEDWQRLRPFLHTPIDWNATDHLAQLDPSFPVVATLKGMTKNEYWRVQMAVRELADKHGLPPIWFEAAWSA